MEVFKELPKKHVVAINSITKGSPNQVPEHPWFKAYPCDPAQFFDNPAYLKKIVATSIMASGVFCVGHAIPIYSLDVMRKDEGGFDTDRYLLELSGGAVLMQKGIHKDFPEHHLNAVPNYHKQ